MAKNKKLGQEDSKDIRQELTTYLEELKKLKNKVEYSKAVVRFEKIMTEEIMDIDPEHPFKEIYNVWKGLCEYGFSTSENLICITNTIRSNINSQILSPEECEFLNLWQECLKYSLEDGSTVKINNEAPAIQQDYFQKPGPLKIIEIIYTSESNYPSKEVLGQDSKAGQNYEILDI